MTRGPAHPADPIDGLAGPILVAVTLAVVAPAAVTAATLAWIIDRRGWRRWPALLAGMSVAAVVATLGGGAATRHALAVLASHGRSSGTVTTMDVVWIAVLQAAVGIAAAPVLLLVTHHRDEHEATRHGRRMSDRRRSDVQAKRFVTRARWPAPPDRTVLGVRLDGAVHGCTTRYRTRALVAVPLADWGRQALIVGETGSGKTVTALTVAAEAMRGGWDVYWIDGKADPDVAGRFLTWRDAAAFDRSTDPATRSTGGGEARRAS